LKTTIKKIEYYLPNVTENGQDLLNDNPDWSIEDIQSKTGIYQRHIATEEDMIEMARLATEKLFDNGVNRDVIDLLILVTQSPAYPLPTSACILHGKLNLKKSCMAFDVNLGCSGFVYALAMCSSLIESGIASSGLIVCSETYTKYIDSSDRTCRPLFSDGAAAVLIAKSSDDKIGPFELGTDGSGAEYLIVKPNVDKPSLPDKLYMNGSQVFMFTMNRVPKCVDALLDSSAINLNDIDMFIFHQASKLVIENLIRRLELDEEKVFVNYKNVGNTVSASIPIALKQAYDEKKLRKGDKVMLVGFGVGLSWGSCLMTCDIEA
jgi:3-oxoacyl-[acyl-carrier-protein] synthase-3